MPYYAKSKLKNGMQPTVKEHSQKVAELSEKYGAECGLEELGKTAGIFHDFGKYSKSFQDVLKGRNKNVDHAIPGAAYLYGCLVRNPALLCRYKPSIEAINGHHDGLIPFGMLEPMLKECLKDNEEREYRDGKKCSIAGTDSFRCAVSEFRRDNPTFRIPDTNGVQSENKVESMLLTRMLFSCLVDADYSASALDENPDYLRQTEFNDADFKRMLAELNRIVEEKRKTSTAQDSVNAIRNAVFEQCGKMGETDEGLYTLTAPTGTGKTLALLHFALRHCIKHGKKRIIIVLPFLTLTEQNARVYRSVFPQLLEAHSQSRLNEQQRMFSERWRVPFILTTSVQFFESLFSDRPTDCRKLHNYANSVVVFDEAQSLPIQLTPATLKAVNALCGYYHTTMVFSTATQPDFSSIEDTTWKPTEILPENRRYYDALKRVNVEWRIHDEEKPTLLQIAEEIAETESVCVIVNIRKHARMIYDRLTDLCDKETVFFLTTDLCAAHRKKVVDEINERLQNGEPCRLVATQCIEAGVDFDFPVLYRALGPLEAIVQAAGRCNRNGKYKTGGRMVVFVPDEPEPLYPGNKKNNWYQTAAMRVLELYSREPIDINNPEHIRAYYQRLYATTKDKPIESEELKTALEGRDFEKTAELYHLIDDNGYRVIVRCDDEEMGALYDRIYQEAVNQGFSAKLMKEAAPITVSVGYAGKKQLEQYAEPLYIKNRITKEQYKSQFYVLCPQYVFSERPLYDGKTGLHLPDNEENHHAAIV